MIPLLLVGGGGHCRSCIDVIETSRKYKIAGIILSEKCNTRPVFDYPVLGSDDELQNMLLKIPDALVTVGQVKSPDIRIHLFETLKNLNARLPIIIASTAYCSQYAIVGQGSILMHYAQVNAAANVGENCIINSQALVEHDAHIDSNCHISTGARINGGVSIGQGSFIGSGSIVCEGVTIGSRVVIGAGQVVKRNITDGKIIK